MGLGSGERSDARLDFMKLVKNSFRVPILRTLRRGGGGGGVGEEGRKNTPEKRHETSQNVRLSLFQRVDCYERF